MTPLLFYILVLVVRQTHQQENDEESCSTLQPNEKQLLKMGSALFNEFEAVVPRSNKQMNFTEYCLPKQQTNNIVDYGDYIPNPKKTIYTISLFSLRKKLKQIDYRINELINYYSYQYISQNITNTNFTFKRQVKLLDPNSKRSIPNLAFLNQKHWKIEVPFEDQFYMQLNYQNLSVFFEDKGYYGAYLIYRICDIDHIKIDYSANEVIRELDMKRCLNIYNRYYWDHRYVVLCFQTAENKDQFVSLLRVYKSYCYPNIKILPRNMFYYQQDFAFNQPIIQYQLYFEPFLDQFMSSYKVTTFYISKTKLYYQTYKYMFRYDLEPIEILFQDIVTESDSHFSCCENIQKENKDDEYQLKIENIDKQDIYIQQQINVEKRRLGLDNSISYDQFCVRIRKNTGLEWLLCSYRENHIDNFIKDMQYYIQMFLLTQVEYPIISSTQQLQYSMNVAYDYLKSINVELDFESCQPVEDDSEQNSEQISFSETDNNINFDLKYKVVKELEQLEDFSEKLLAKVDNKGSIFTYLKEKLNVVCRERRKYK